VPGDGTGEGDGVAVGQAVPAADIGVDARHEDVEPDQPDLLASDDREGAVTSGGTYNAGVYGARNICGRVSGAGLASRSFVGRAVHRVQRQPGVSAATGR
jgi:hypothetical protein